MCGNLGAMSIGTSTASARESAAPLRQRLRDALGVAIKERDRVAVGALRSALAAIENAEAVDVAALAEHGGAAGGTNLAIERIPIGVGAAEVARRELTEGDVERIVRGEVAEREAAAATYERAGQGERAGRLREEMRVLGAHLAQ